MQMCPLGRCTPLHPYPPSLPPLPPPKQPQIPPPSWPVDNTDLISAQVAAAQQYSVTLRGYPALHDWVKNHTWALHNPPGDHDVLVTGGSNATIEVLPMHSLPGHHFLVLAL